MGIKQRLRFIKEREHSGGEKKGFLRLREAANVRVLWTFLFISAGTTIRATKQSIENGL